MKKILMHTRTAIAPLAFVLAIAASFQTAGAAGPAVPAQGIPQPKILVIDRQAILVRSAVGQSIMQQAQVYTQQAQAQLKSEAAGLRSQGQALQQQLAILSADVKARKIHDFEAQQNA